MQNLGDIWIIVGYTSIVITQQVWVVGNVKVYVISGNLELCCPNLIEFNLVHVIFFIAVGFSQRL